MPIEGVNVAFSDTPLEATPTWTRLDATPNLIGQYTIQRGRQDELSRTQTGVATIALIDSGGLLDPTNAGALGTVDPYTQAAIALQHPNTSTWYTLFRGFVDELEYDVHPAQSVMFGSLGLVDIFDMLASIEISPGGTFGQNPNPAWVDAENVFYEDASPVQARFEAILTAIGVPAALFEVFTGNVVIDETVVAAGTSVLSVLQDAADAEFPGLANLYVDKDGVIRFKGRQPRFRPTVVEYDVNVWKAGDGEAALADGNMAQIRGLKFSRSKAAIINAALALPQPPLEGFTEAQITGNIVTDSSSITAYGLRTWSAENLLTLAGTTTGNNALQETQLFSEYYVANYKDPTNRVNQITFRSIHPDDPRSAATWNVLCRVELGDIIRLTVTHPGGGGFSEEDFFVDGINYTVGPADPDVVPDVTLTVDVTPRALYNTNPFDSDPDPA